MQMSSNMKMRSGRVLRVSASIPVEFVWHPPVYTHMYTVQFSSVQSLSRVRLFATPWIAVRQASLSITSSRSSSRLFSWGGQSTGVSALASFLPKKSQGWSPSECTGWISLQSKGLSRIFSNTTVQKHQFFGVQPSSQRTCVYICHLCIYIHSYVYIFVDLECFQLLLFSAFMEVPL